MTRDVEEEVETVPVAEIYADIAGIAEIADALGVKTTRVKRWIERRYTTNCPMPVRELGVGYIYSLREWRAWFALWRVTRGSETWLRSLPKDQSNHP